MLPISVDLSRIRVLLVGAGSAVQRRLALLAEAGAHDLEVYAPDAADDLIAAAGTRLRQRLPSAEEIGRARLVFIAGLNAPTTARLSTAASAAGVLVNVEDDTAQCDFHSAAILRRGDLTIAVSTNGRSPGLAAAIRHDLETRYGPEWQGALARLAALRATWQSEGADHRTIADRTADWLAQYLRNAGG